MGYTDCAKRYLDDTFSQDHLLLIGYGGTISSGYTPTDETIVPLAPSPAKKSIEFMNAFQNSKLKFDHIPLLDKDSRDVTDDDLYTLFDIIFLSKNRKILITVGTYLWPKITKALFLFSGKIGTKKIISTGSMLPAGFLASDAEANIWSAITLLNFIDHTFSGTPFVGFVFHGNTYATKESLDTLDLHPKDIENMVIQYPLSTIPVIGI
jgi:L-asparaginase/Glu-tRNA(Gln) amidotransferase subunit D